MSLQSSVSFEVEIDRKSLSPNNAPAVAKRLESWKSPSPTKEDIENRICAANTLREQTLTAPVLKNNARFQKVSQNKIVLGEKMKMALDEKKVEITEKMDAASLKVDSLTKSKVEKVAQHNSKVDSTKDIVSETMKRALDEKKVEITEKMDAASLKVDSLTKSKVEKVAQHNSKVDSTKDIVAQSTSLKAIELIDNHVRKMDVANTNFQDNLAQKVLSAAVHNEEVKEKHVKVLSGEDIRSKELAKANAAKMNSAANAKQSFITEKVMAVGQTTRDKSERGKQALLNHQAKADSIKESLLVKIETATAKRDSMLKEKVLKSATKRTSPKKSQSKDDGMKLNVKMEDAAARREALLMMRSEQCGIKNERVKEVSSTVKNSPTKRSYDTPSKVLHKEDDAVITSPTTPAQPTTLEAEPMQGRGGGEKSEDDDTRFGDDVVEEDGGNDDGGEERGKGGCNVF